MFLVSPNRPQKRMFNPTRTLVHSPVYQTIFFLLAHVPLAYILRLNDWFGTAHAVFILLYGLNAALQKRLSKILFALAYITGAEVLWRMTSANIPWEFAKYGSVLIVVAALLMEGRVMKHDGKRPSRTPWLVVYLALLLPAVIVPIASVGFFQSRTDISFNMSGPLALALLGLYFWNRKLNMENLITTLLAVIGPICGIWFLAAFSTVTREVVFILESNFVTSGGYGPNQVSNILGLGALAALILIVVLEELRPLKITLFFLMGAFLVQAMLTFSRGGVYSFFFAMLVFALHIVRTKFVRKRLFFIVLISCLLGLWLITPQLDRFTGGLLWDRLSSLETTGRAELAEADFEAFLENPVTGLGVGGTKVYHQQVLGDPRAAHTEYTRLIAEHGIFGVLSLVVILGLVCNRYLRHQEKLSRALVVAFSVWSFAVMGQSAMRFVAISFILALAFVYWQFENQEEPTN